jgi:hypothetical protein
MDLYLKSYLSVESYACLIVTWLVHKSCKLQVGTHATELFPPKLGKEFKKKALYISYFVDQINVQSFSARVYYYLNLYGHNIFFQLPSTSIKYSIRF